MSGDVPGGDVVELLHTVVVVQPQIGLGQEVPEDRAAHELLVAVEGGDVLEPDARPVVVRPERDALDDPVFGLG